MAKEFPFEVGDRVSWPVGTGHTTGTIQDIITESTQLNGQSVDASKDEPRYFIKNDNTDKVTSHRPETLSPANSPQDRLQPGDTVEWNTAQGTTSGTVEKKLTQPTQIKNYDVSASEEDPKYLVKSEKTGAKAAHKPDALDKV